ncbi:MAG: hypothetical protein KAR20_24180, partial [Candidatus Heimdallarchaeota archaeon]|nr:hypothetical protein [Candidatus Heimdallarchaeota archaeon]
KVVEKLKNEITIAVGRSLYVESEFQYTPTYTCISDIRTILDLEYLKMLQSSKTIPLITTQLYHQAFNHNMCIPEGAFKTMRDSIEVPYIDTVGHSDDETSLDLEKGTFIRGNVVQDMAIPLASWMGCKNIYLVGCDGHGGYFYDNSRRVDMVPSVSRQYKYYKLALLEKDQNLINLSDSIFDGVENMEFERICKDSKKIN